MTSTRLQQLFISLIFLALGSYTFLSSAPAQAQTLANPNTSPGPKLKQQHTPISVDIAWLDAHHNDPKLLIIDARSANQYKAGHLPQAVNLPVEQTFGPEPRPDLLAPISHIQTLFQTTGIQQSGQQLVIYDGGEHINAARIFWALEVYGHQHVAVLDGGLPAWQAQHPNKALQRQANRKPKGNFVPSLNPDALATKLAVRLGLNRPKRVLIDVRSREEYQGKKTIAKRAGHIPGALSIPWTDNLRTIQGVQRLKPLDELRQLYQNVHADSLPTIAYCNKGKQSALTYFVLRQLGGQVAAYDGSWFEWGNDPSLPIVSPQAPFLSKDPKVTDPSSSGAGAGNH